MLVWVVLLCLCAALPNGRTGADECMLWSDSLTSVGYRARHGMVACTPRATWSRYLFGHLARFGLPPPLISHLVAPFGRLTWCPHTRLSRACAWPRWARPSAHRRRSEPSDRPDRFDPPFVPAMGNTSGAHFLRRKALATFLGGEFEAVASRPWSRPLTWWGMPSRGAARRSCRTRAGGHSGMGSRMRAD